MTAVHLRGVDQTKTACGRLSTSVLTDNLDEVTCQRCRTTVRFQSMSAVTSSVTPFLLTQQQHIDHERNYTVREYLAYITDWDDAFRKGKAHQRLMDGFRRQVRLSGLEREVREGATP